MINKTERLIRLTDMKSRHRILGIVLFTSALVSALMSVMYATRMFVTYEWWLYICFSVFLIWLAMFPGEKCQEINRIIEREFGKETIKTNIEFE